MSTTLNSAREAGAHFEHMDLAWHLDFIYSLVRSRILRSFKTVLCLVVTATYLIIQV